MHARACADVIGVNELEIGLVDEGSSSEGGIAIPLAALVMRNRPELFVDDWKKSLEGGAITILEISEQVGDRAGPGFAGITH
jgi:hypothetical protein